MSNNKEFAANQSTRVKEINKQVSESGNTLGSKLLTHTVESKIKELEQWAYQVGKRALTALTKSEEEVEKANKIKPDNVIVSPQGVRTENYTQDTYNKKAQVFNIHNQLVDMIDKSYAGGEDEIKLLENFLNKHFK